MSTQFLYITGSDLSANRVVSTADAYLFTDPISGIDSYYRQTADGSGWVLGSGVTYSQNLTGTTFSDNISAPLIYKRTNNITFSTECCERYSQYDTFVFILSGIEDTLNNIIRVDWRALSGGEVNTIQYDIDREFNSDYVYDLAADGPIGGNPKNSLTYKADYDLNSLSESLTTFTPSFTAFRQDGFIDVYDCSLTISKDSIYNVADKLKLLDSQVLPISSLDPLLKVELESPDYVDNLVIRRAVTPTPTLTRTGTGLITPTPTQTTTQTITRTISPTITITKSPTPTPTQTQTQTPTRTVSPTQNVSATGTATRTPTRTSTKHARSYPTPTPTHSPTAFCNSKICTVNYSGSNDKVNVNDVTVNLVYDNVEAGNTKQIISKKPSSVFGTYNLLFYIPRDYVDNYLSCRVDFLNDDPEIHINSVTITDTCSNKEIDKSTPDEDIKLPDPIPLPTPTPQPSPTYKPELPGIRDISENTDYYTFIFYPGAQNTDAGEIVTGGPCFGGFDLPCERKFEVIWSVLKEGEAFSNGKYEKTLVGCTEEMGEMGAPLYIKIPYNKEISDSSGRIAGDEVIGGNYTFSYTSKWTAISNDPSSTNADGDLNGPCTVGDYEYNGEVIFAGPNQDRFNYTVIDKETWLDQDKNFTLVLSQS